ncbi:Uncharacterised protein g9533 [Pycnogonum litorale]
MNRLQIYTGFALLLFINCYLTDHHPLQSLLPVSKSSALDVTSRQLVFDELDLLIGIGSVMLILFLAVPITTMIAVGISTFMLPSPMRPQTTTFQLPTAVLPPADTMLVPRPVPGPGSISVPRPVPVPMSVPRPVPGPAAG